MERFGSGISCRLGTAYRWHASCVTFRAALRQAMDVPILQTTAPCTLEAHVYRQPDQLVLHLVNYNRSENASGKSAVAREAPIAVEPNDFHLALPAGTKIKHVRFLILIIKANRNWHFYELRRESNSEHQNSVFTACVC